MSWIDDVERFKRLEKLATITSTLQTAYIGGRMNNIANKLNGDNELLEAAYDVSSSGQTMDEAINDASEKKYMGAALATLATSLAIKSKLPLKFTLPAALASLGMASHFADQESKYEQLKGKKLMMNGLKDLK